MKYLVFLLPLLAACRPADVVAEVGGRNITLGDVELRQRERKLSADAALDSLIADERLAATAVKRKLDERADVRARLEAAELAILSQALLDAEVGLPSDKDLRAAYDADKRLETRQLELAHVFIAIPTPVTTESSQLAQSKATAVWAKLLDGEPFEELAKKFSEDLATRDLGGALGVVREGRVDAAIFEVAVSLEPGAFSKPVQTPFGYHVLKALSRVSTVKPSFDEARGSIEARLRDEKMKSLVEGLEGSVQSRKVVGALEKLKAAPRKEETR